MHLPEEELTLSIYRNTGAVIMVAAGAIIEARRDVSEPAVRDTGGRGATPKIRGGRVGNEAAFEPGTGATGHWRGRDAIVVSACGW